MKVLLDECVHQRYRHELKGHQAFTTRYLKWDGIKNGRLLATAASAGFDAMVTTDRNIEHQQNVGRLPLTVYVLHSKSDDLDDLRELSASLLAAMEQPPPVSAFVHVRR